ncbi:hypothetical protein GFER_07735 [Geoalkalibacter ferrihydriticus DSM 17813]|uniref:Uncharacterized protein n=2 Tax=Geoalkalibacter ferrihydriticus TaxID=392333 RepID=A0A0C2EEB7_9BACT|nr:hypothetical protein [Geoalkalibacter ferrihydriticus]KIH76963.1 hypothetical protein GFER_07735 [Geoalkalibacter ferrihydriticus DSM 17813]
MFALDEDRDQLPIASTHVVRLLRSINPVPVALSGFPGQRAGAFLCVFRAGRSLRVSVVLELFDSARLVFYNNEQGTLGPQEVDAVIDEGLYFVESMGFLMTDLEVQTLSREQREQMWRALPLADGVRPAPVPAVALSGADGSRKPGAVAAKLPDSVVPDAVEVRRQRLIDSVGRMLAAF